LTLNNKKVPTLLPFASLPVSTLNLYKVTGSAWDFKNLQYGNIEEIRINASDLSKAKFSDLATLPSLRTLKLDLSTLPSALEFREFESLAHLSLGSNDRLASITVEAIPTLETLSLGPNFTLKTVTLASLPSLQNLDLSYTDIDVPDLSDMSSLVSLDLQHNVDVLSDPDQNLRKLPVSMEVLNLQKNGLDSLEFARRLTNLKTLRISGNRITDLSPLADLPSLELLELDQNPITASIKTCPVASAKSAVLANFCRQLLGL
jgi:internalin A